MRTIKYRKQFSILFLLLLLMIFSFKGSDEIINRDKIDYQFKPTKEEINEIIASTYGDWRDILLRWDGYWRVQEIGADEIVIPVRPNGWDDGGIYRKIHEHNWAIDDDIVVQTWDRTYTAISNCNFVIDQIESGYLPLEEQKTEVLAELKVLRASYYYILIDLYGNVPLITQYSLENKHHPQQQKRDEVFTFIVNEITNNLNYLSSESSTTTYGRFNKWAAHTLLAKMYLNAKVYTGTPMWNKCIEQCDAVINSNAGYKLEDNQKNVFITENQDSKEIIFGLSIDEHSTTAWNQFDIHMQTCQPSMQKKYKLQAKPWGGMCAIPQFIDTFDPEDKRLTQNFMMGQQYSANGDPLYVSVGDKIGEPLILVNELPGVHTSQATDGYRFEKFEIAPGSSNILNNDFPLFRYADVLMMKAECLLRTGKADDAATIVSKVRARAFDNPEKAKVTGDELKQGSLYNYGQRNEFETTYEGGDDIEFGRFLDELGWEFNQEGRRRQDMIRFDVYTNKSWLSHAPNGDYHKLYPIPAKQLESNPKLKQNIGYEQIENINYHKGKLISALAFIFN
ncbi:MAG TPA: RagB/SusD family nutrient uptake outer membrane protein [Draconibacterium sp.]|nr:RagB/SusD family nutrient uptake outer membrane protein [Draconibacterium sp.]